MIIIMIKCRNINYRVLVPTTSPVGELRTGRAWSWLHWTGGPHPQEVFR